MAPVRLASVLTLLGSLTVVVPLTLGAQQEDYVSTRTLGGHLFIPSNAIDEPFVSTVVRTETGGGIAFDIVREIDSDILQDPNLEGDLAFLALRFGYAHALFEWFSLGISASSTARLGVNGQSLLSEGVTSLFSVEFEALARIFQTESWILSGNVQVSPLQSYTVGILDWVAEVIQEGQITDDNTIVTSRSGTGSSLGLRTAYGATPWLGFVAMGDIALNRAIEQGSPEEPEVALGLQASLDFEPLWGLPLGLFALGRYDEADFENAGSEWISTLGGGLAYTGREDFSITVETQRIKLPLADSEDFVSAVRGSLNLRYYF